MDLSGHTFQRVNGSSQRPAGVLCGAWRPFLAFVCLFLAHAVSSAGTHAEKLPLRRFGAADGLPSNSVNLVKRDSRGFLWFCTAEGLSRFDGFHFVNYGIDQGLPDRLVSDFLETREGEYWVATLRGLAKFNPKPSPGVSLFTTVPLGDDERSKHINELFQDRDGVIWVATDKGAFYRSPKQEQGFQYLDLGPRVRGKVCDFVVQDHEGNLWMTFGRDLDVLFYRRRPDGSDEFFSDPFLKRNRVTYVLVDSEDRIWASTYHGVALLSHQPADTKLVARTFHQKDGLPDEQSDVLFQASDGRLWMANGGLTEIIGSGENVRFKVIRNSEPNFGYVQAEDRSGNLWMGPLRFSPHGFSTYGTEDGLRTEDIRSILEGQDGQVYVVTGIHGQYLHRFDGKRFVAVTPFIPGHDASWDWGSWGWGQTHFQDHLGEWWLATSYGLMRYPKVERLEDLGKTPPRAIYTTKDGLGGNGIFRLYEDSRGDIWISSWGDHAITRWNRATGRFELPAVEGSENRVATAFREDRSGNLWMGLWGRDLVRRHHGTFEILGARSGFPDGQVNSIWLDHAGRIWAGTSRGGLVRIDDPDAERVQFKVYAAKDGLSSNDVRAITEDRRGTIYFWTGRGVDRLEPETGGLAHYTTEDGLVPAGSDNQEAFCDRKGNLWFGYVGLSRLEPRLELDALPELPVFISHIRVRGEALPISELGETDLSGLVFQPNQNNLEIEFGGLNFDTREILRFQYKLENTDSDWSSPTGVRTVNYASLRPGNYRFLARVVNGRGQVSATPAVMSFRVLAPIWARGWFLSLAAMVMALIAYGIYQLRMKQLLEVERVRTRIASDLHDDVGSGLTQIAILSEIAKREISADKGERLAHIANLSREMVDGMSEIVWAMNPQRDHLADLVQRMRGFASDVFEASGTEFGFAAPPGEVNLPLRSDLRRQIYLIFKEAVNNSTRHSGCTRVQIHLAVDDGELSLKVSDNGRGLCEGQTAGGGLGGHGLKNMQHRAEGIGGSLEINSKPGEGTEICLRVPLARKFKDFLKTT